VPAVKRLGDINIRIYIFSHVVTKKQLTKTEANSIPEERLFRCLSFATSEHPIAPKNFVIHTCRSKDEFCRTEPVRIMHGNREPDEAEEKVEHEDKDREAEDALVPIRREVIDRDGYDQHQFGDSPDECSPFDVVVSGTTGKVDLPYSEL
jgi:hypothetical protein